MRKRFLAATLTVALASPVLSGAGLANEEIKLPPEVTPQLRAACERDVRRLCIGTNPTYDKVKQCVGQKFSQLGSRCQIALASAGFGR